MKKIWLKSLSALLTLAILLISITGCGLISPIVDAYLSQIDDQDENKPLSTEEAINQITTSTIRSTLSVVVKFRTTTATGWVSETYIGSAVVIRAIDDSGFYALTNAHCVINDESKRTSVELFDYLGNSIKDVYISESMVSEEYDLALIKFYSDNNKIIPISLAESSPSLGDTVISLGTPHGQVNSVTFGELLNIYRGDLIDFDTLYHSALIGNGSSGGALLNNNLELCGINFAGEDTDEDFNFGIAIPIEKVREFLDGFSSVKDL